MNGCASLWAETPPHRAPPTDHTAYTLPTPPETILLWLEDAHTSPLEFYFSSSHPRSPGPQSSSQSWPPPLAMATQTHLGQGPEGDRGLPRHDPLCPRLFIHQIVTKCLRRPGEERYPAQGQAASVGVEDSHLPSGMPFVSPTGSSEMHPTLRTLTALRTHLYGLRLGLVFLLHGLHRGQ